MPTTWRPLLALAAALVTACTTTTAPSSSQRSEPAVSDSGPLVIAVRGEPYSVSTHALEGGGAGVNSSMRIFNAGFELIDDRGVPHPYLAEALPELNSDSWRVLPDGRMETRYHLRPNLVWHDGT